jgi:flagellar FliL protein
MKNRILNYFLIFIPLMQMCGSASPSGGGAGDANSPYFELPAPFIVNLNNKNGITFLQVNAQFRVNKPENKSHLTMHLPAIQHTMVILLSEKSSDDVRTVSGKEKLRQEALTALQEMFTEKVGDPVIEEVYFTGFIIQ